MTQDRRLVAAVLAAVLAGTLVVSGCRSGQSTTNSRAKGRPLTAKDVPVKPGLTRAFVSNDPNVSPFVPVEFGFEGPWDFREGPIDTLIVTRQMKPSRGYDAAEFPKATIAQSIAIKGQEATATVAYFSNSSGAYVSYGQAGKALGTNVFAKPETILQFPLAVGKSWSERIMLRATPPTRLDVARKVVGQGAVTVPAGTFKNSAMIQIKKTITLSDGTTSSQTSYEWYAPGVGIVVWIAGPKDEPEPLFKEATFFERLKTYTK